jgi:hypothetical protein
MEPLTFVSVQREIPAATSVIAKIRLGVPIAGGRFSQGA